MNPNRWVDWTVGLVPLEVCPVAPPGAQVYVDQVTGYVAWGVLVLFGIGITVAIGGIVAARIFHLHGGAAAAVIGLGVVFLAIILYLVLPGMGFSMIGRGCLPSFGSHAPATPAP